MGRSLLWIWFLCALLLWGLWMAIQLFPLRDLWRQVSGFSKLGIAMWGALALCEAALPLTGALASGLAYGRLRQEGALLAFQMLGPLCCPIRRPAKSLARAVHFNRRLAPRVLVAG